MKEPKGIESSGQSLTLCEHFPESFSQNMELTWNIKRVPW